jgi:hypothetical protein
MESFPLMELAWDWLTYLFTSGILSLISLFVFLFLCVDPEPPQ